MEVELLISYLIQIPLPHDGIFYILALIVSRQKIKFVDIEHRCSRKQAA